MRIIFARHGLTNDNIDGILQGYKNTHLNAEGKKQSKKVAERLKSEKIDTVYVSDLIRTRQTAKEILKYHPNAEVIIDKELRERNYGIFEGKTNEDLREAAKNSKKTYWGYRPKNGESILDFNKRILKFFNKITKRSHENILIVTHGGFIIGSFITLMKENKQEYRKYIHGNTGISIIEIKNKKVKILKLNCQKHLD